MDGIDVFCIYNTDSDMELSPVQTKQELRQFGFLIGGLIALIFGLGLPLLKGHSLPPWPWVVALVLGSLALLTPRALQPIYRLWMRFGAVMGWINTRIILGLVFYFLLWPTGLLMKLFRHDPMQRRPAKNQASYRSPCESKAPDTMERPY